MEVLGCNVIGFAPEQEGGNLLQRCQGIACCNDAHIEQSIIKISVRRHLYDISIAARVANDHLQGLPFPDRVLLMFFASDAYLHGERMLPGEFFGSRKSHRQGTDPVLERFGDVPHNSRIDTQSCHQ